MVNFSRDLTSSQAKKIDQLEEELVRMENQIEQKQLDWETKEIQLESLDEVPNHFEIGKKQNKNLKSQHNEVLTTPNPDWPLAKQLEQALGLTKSQAKTIEGNKVKMSEARKLIEDLKKKIREADSKVLANDRIINDLRLQIPNTVDRALAFQSVTGGGGLPAALTTGKVKISYGVQKQKIQSPEKLLILFYIDNSIANISLYALSWPKLYFG